MFLELDHPADRTHCRLYQPVVDAIHMKHMQTSQSSNKVRAFKWNNANCAVHAVLSLNLLKIVETGGEKLNFLSRKTSHPNLRSFYLQLFVFEELTHLSNMNDMLLLYQILVYSVRYCMVLHHLFGHLLCADRALYYRFRIRLN